MGWSAIEGDPVQVSFLPAALLKLQPFPFVGNLSMHILDTSTG